MHWATGILDLGSEVLEVTRSNVSFKVCAFSTFVETCGSCPLVYVGLCYCMLLYVLLSSCMLLFLSPVDSELQMLYHTSVVSYLGAQAKHVPEVFLSEAVNALNGWSQARLWETLWNRGEVPLYWLHTLGNEMLMQIVRCKLWCKLWCVTTSLTPRKEVCGISAFGTSPCRRWRKSSGQRWKVPSLAAVEFQDIEKRKTYFEWRKHWIELN